MDAHGLAMAAELRVASVTVPALAAVYLSTVTGLIEEPEETEHCNERQMRVVCPNSAVE